jgi:PAS domain S-box-containing protein
VVESKEKITEHRLAETRIQHLNNKLRAISNVNRLIACEKDRERLVSKICGLLVENQGWELAWILLAGKDQSFITAVSDGADERFPILVEQMKHGNYPQCVRDTLIQGQPFIACDDVREQHKECVLSNCHARGGAFAARLEHGGKVYGTITVSILSELVMDREEQGMFLELVTDLSHALACIESEKERKRADEALREALLYNRNLIEASLDPLLTISPEGKITDANNAAELVTGLPREKLTGSDFSDYFTEPEKAREGYQKVFKKGFVKDYSLAIRHVSGSTIDVLYNASVYNDAAGNAAGVFAAARDITERKRAEDELQLAHDELEQRVMERTSEMARAIEALKAEIDGRKQAEEALRKSEELYRSLVENINFGITIVDKDFRIIMTNTEICRWFNKSAREFAGKNCFEEFEKRQAVCPHCPGVKTMATGHPAQVETEGVREDGTRFPVEVHTFPVFEADGTVYGFIELIEDITERKRTKDALQLAHDELELRVMERTSELARALEALKAEIDVRKQAEEKLKESKERFRSLVETTSDWIWEVDANDIYTYASPRIRELLGYEPQELIGRTPFDLMPPEEAERVAAEFNASKENQMSVFGLEKLNLHKDGGNVILETNGVPIFDVDGKFCGYRGIDRDITERKHREEEYKKAYEELKKTQIQLIQSGKLAAMGEMSAGIVHELTQPLLGISGFAAALHEDLNDLQVKSAIADPDIRKFMEQSAADLDMIRQQTDRMTQIMNRMRTFAHESRTGKEWIEINPRIENVLALFSQQLRFHNIQVVTNLTSGLPQIFCNANELAQVMINLITNARDAMDAKGQEGQLTITTGESGSGIYIEVEDTGTGADTEAVSHMFEPFFTTKNGGMGLGLSIIHRIITDHGGTINVECRQGEGCKFTIRLPSGGM